MTTALLDTPGPTPTLTRRVVRRARRGLVGPFGAPLLLSLAAVALWGAHGRLDGWIAVARPAAYLQFGLVAASFACLTLAFGAGGAEGKGPREVRHGLGEPWLPFFLPKNVLLGRWQQAETLG